MKRRDSILQNYYMSKLPKAQGGLTAPSTPNTPKSSSTMDFTGSAGTINPTATNCPEGYEFDQSTGQCRPIITLPNVYVFSPRKYGQITQNLGPGVGQFTYRGNLATGAPKQSMNDFSKPIIGRGLPGLDRQIRMGDLLANNRIASNEQIARNFQIEQQIRARDIENNYNILRNTPGLKLYSDQELQRYAQQSKDKWPKFVQQNFDEESNTVYNVVNHPDYNPSVPVSSQRNLAADNSLRTMILRGRNKAFGEFDRMNPVLGTALKVLASPGSSAANLSLDAENRYLNPNQSVGQNLLNLGLDVASVAPIPVAQGVGTGLKTAVTTAGKYLNAPLTIGSRVFPSVTAGNLLAAYGASDFLVNRAPQIPGQIARGQYGEAALNTTLGTLDLVGANMVSPSLVNNAFRLANQGRQYLSGTYRNIAEGDNIFNYAWRSPAAGITDDVASRMYQQTRNSVPLDESAKDIIAEYQHTSGPFTGRFESGNVNLAKRLDLENAIAERNLVTQSGKPNVLIRRFDPDNPELYSLNESGQFILNRPTSWSVGRGWDYTSKPNRIVFKLPSGSRGMLNEYNAAKFDQDVSKLMVEKEAILGSGLNLGKRLGKVKNEFGGYDYIHRFEGYKPTEWDDIRRLNTENIGEIVDLNKNIAAGGNFNLGVYPFFKNPNILLKLGKVSQNEQFGLNNRNVVTGIPELLREMPTEAWGKIAIPFREINMSGLTSQTLNRPVIPNSEILGSIMQRAKGKPLSEYSVSDLENIQPWDYQDLANSVKNLANKGVSVDFYGDNFLLNKTDYGRNQFNLFDIGLLPNTNTGSFPVGPLYGLDAKAFSQGVNRIDPKMIKSILQEKMRRAVYESASKAGEGAYSDQEIFDAIQRINDRIQRADIKYKKGGESAGCPRGYIYVNGECVLKPPINYGDLVQQSGVPSQTEVARQANIKKEAEAYEKKKEARARYEKTPKVGPAKQRNYSEQIQAEEQKRRLNQAYADQNPEVMVDESGNIVTSGYGRFMQTYGSNLDKFARSWETPLAIEGAASLAPLIGRGLAKGVTSVGGYLGNTYMNVAKGESALPIAWKSPAVGLSQQTSQGMFNSLINSGKLTDAERALLVDYTYNPSPFTRPTDPIGEAKRQALNDLIKKYKLDVGEDVILTRKFDPANTRDLDFGDRPLSFSAGIGQFSSSNKDRLVVPSRYTKQLGDNLLVNDYSYLSNEAIQRMFPDPLGQLHLRQLAMDLRGAALEREVIGTGLKFKRLGKVKNDIGGYDYIVAPKKQQDGGDIPVDPMGYWNPENVGGPIINQRGFMDGAPPKGSNWRIMGDGRGTSITMDLPDMPDEILVVPDGEFDQAEVMKKGEDKYFMGADFVDEYLLQNGGGTKKKKKTLILAEEPLLKKQGEFSREYKNPFEIEAQKIKKYVNQYFPDEEVEIIPAYGKEFTEGLKKSDPNTRLVFLAHHGDNLFGIPADEVIGTLSRTPYENCYAGTCYGTDLHGVGEFNRDYQHRVWEKTGSWTGENPITYQGMERAPESYDLKNFYLRRNHIPWLGFSSVGRGGEEGFRDSFFRITQNPIVTKLFEALKDPNISRDEANALWKRIEKLQKANAQYIAEPKGADYGKLNVVPYPMRTKNYPSGPIGIKNFKQLGGNALGMLRDYGGGISVPPKYQERPGTIGGREFVQQWMQSPMYSQMLAASAQGPEFERINAGRISNLNVPVNVSTDIHLHGTNTLGQKQHRIRTMFNATVPERDEMIRVLQAAVDNPKDKEAKRKADQIMQPVVTGWNIGLNPNLKPGTLDYEAVLAHEYGHTTDDPFVSKLPHQMSKKELMSQDLLPYIPKSDIAKMQSYYQGKVNNDLTKYVSKPQETRQYLTSLRYLGKMQGVYDPFTEKITPEQYKRIKPTEFNDPAEMLRNIYTDEQIIDMLNSISMNRNQGLPYAKSGGQHGGLDRWFAEKWVDVKTGKPCGRQEGENRAYPACRPSKRVSSKTPKTSSELSSAEKEKFKRSKTSSERIPYSHKRRK